MIGVRTAARSLLAGTFIVGGIDALRKPAAKAEMAEGIAEPAAEALGLDKLVGPMETETLVRVNGGIQVLGGAMLVFGIVPRLGATLLAVSLVPTTLAGHRFWEQRDPEQRQKQLMQFLKNAGLLGGLTFAALDTGGRPSVFWSGRRAAASAAHSVGDTARRVTDAVTPG